MGSPPLAQGLEHQRAGRLAEAETIYRTILDQQPEHPDAWHLLGLISFRNGQAEEAVERIRRAITSNPASAVYYDNLGRILEDQGRVEEATECFRQLVRLRPEEPEAHLRLGNNYLRRERFEDAAACFRRVLELQPGAVEALSRLGYSLRQQGRSREALEPLRRALDVAADSIDALVGLGAALQDLGESQEAAAIWERVLRLDPEHAQAHHNLGLIRRSQGRLEEAIHYHRQALERQPEFAEAHNALGVALIDQCRVEEALASYREALRLAPGHAAAHSNLLLSLHYLPQEDPELLLEEHRQWDRQHAATLEAERAPHPNPPDPDRPLRIGYLSPDFRAHPVAFFFRPILETHSRGEVACYCYSNVGLPDRVTESLRALAENWRDIRGMSDEQVANLVRQDQIDILVDLAGHTGDNRLRVLARRPAPIQVTYLGYPNTTGITAIDYRLTDAWSDPPGETDQWHTEELVRLPAGFLCFRPLAGSPDVGEPPVLRTGTFTFGCFNTLAKLTDQTIGAWAAILQAVPGSRLLLKSPSMADQATRRRLIERLQAQGVEPDRVELLEPTASLAHHMEAYNRVDLALDTFPYNGATTTCEALWMGVPVVTRAGRTHAARVGLSLLARMGLEEFVADSWQGYVEVATRLARDPERLRGLRAGLRPRMETSSLTDAAGFVRQLEQAYRRMWQRWCQQQAPVDTVRQRIASFPYWYHRIELPGGVTTPGWAPLKPEAYRIPAGLAGKRVLDVGAWDGYWSFEALRRGARQVVAIDDFSDYLGSLRSSDRRAWETFDFCRQALGYDPQQCRRLEMTVYEASEERLGRFDVVFFFGTLYHLRHPLLALEKLASLCDGEIYVESAILDDFSPYRGGLDHGYPGEQMVMEFYPDNQYGNNQTNWWAPSLHCLGHMVRASGFDQVEMWKLTATPPTHVMVCRGFVRGTKKDRS